MGIISWLKGKIGVDKALKLLAILGGFFIYMVGNFPMAETVMGLDIHPAYAGYLTLIWSAFVIAFSAIIILFFGKSDTLPPLAPNIEVIEESFDSAEEVDDEPEPES